MFNYELDSREIVLLRDSLLSHLSEISSLKRDSSYWDSYYNELNQLFIKLFPLGSNHLFDYSIAFHATGVGYSKEEK